MDPSTEESLSALADGELAGEQAGALARQLAADPALRARWGRHHLLQAALQADTPIAPPALTRAVRERIAGEPALLVKPATRPAAAPQRPPARLGKPAAGLAIAASVAALAVVAVDRLNPPQPVAGAPVEVAESVTGSRAPGNVDPLAVPGGLPLQTVNAGGSPPQLINGYIVNFNEARAPGGLSGVNPYVRIVGYGNPQPEP